MTAQTPRRRQCLLCAGKLALGSLNLGASYVATPITENKKQSYNNKQPAHSARACYFATPRGWLDGWRAKLGGVAGELLALALAGELDFAAALGLVRTSAPRCRAQ